MNTSVLKNQILPIALTFAVCGVLIGFLWLEITLVNQALGTNISLSLRAVDVIVGLTIYLKTSIDFAIYIGNLMKTNNSWKSRIAIEVGTALGNAMGTFVIILLWALFKNIHWLSALMILVAALVLFKLAEDGLEHAHEETGNGQTRKAWYAHAAIAIEKILKPINKFLSPVLSRIMPSMSMKNVKEQPFFPLLMTAILIPFILGLDDFAGYLPLFDIVNIFGFAIGVFLGHMVLNILLYVSPQHTIKAVKNPIISLFGGVAFIGLGLWGLVEVVKILMGAG